MDHEEPKQSSKPPLKHYDYKYIKSFISGGFAGIAAKSLIAPFDRIKILFQVNSLFECEYLYKRQLRGALPTRMP